LEMFRKTLGLKLPPAASTDQMLALAPRLLQQPSPEDAFQALDAHTRAGGTERRRHELVCGLLWEWLHKKGYEVHRDVALGSLPADLRPHGVSKLSRRIDLVGVDPTSRRLDLIEVTVVRDDQLESRVKEKEAKYADLPPALAKTPRVQAQELKVCEPLVFALGVYGTIPPSTMQGVCQVAGCPENQAEVDALVQEAQMRVLIENTWPFSARGKRPSFSAIDGFGVGTGSAGQMSTSGYLKRRQFSARRPPAKKRRSRTRK